MVTLIYNPPKNDCVWGKAPDEKCKTDLALAGLITSQVTISRQPGKTECRMKGAAPTFFWRTMLLQPDDERMHWRLPVVKCLVAS
jgi:hypothetical protein